MPEKISFLKVKQALLDPRFRDSLPPTFAPEIDKFLKNPGCSCNVPIYKKVLSEGGDQLRLYFPDLEYVPPAIEAERMAQNNWIVINCHVDDLEARLKKLPPGRKQVEAARHGDQVTVIVNELDVIFT